VAQHPVARALVVDDSPTQALEVRLNLVRLGLEVQMAAGGRQALEAVAAAPPDIVFTDLVMPDMDGLALVQALRASHPAIPVVLLTAHGSEEIAAQALRQGAADYIPKKHLRRDLPRTLENLLAQARGGRTRRQMLDCLAQTETGYVLENDRSLIPPLVVRLQENMACLRLFDENQRMRVGMALREALMNAMEHGNLEVSSELRERDDDSYFQLAEVRRRQAPYADRRVYVRCRESREGVAYTIRDEGPGFDPSRLPDPTDPANLEKASGRGLLLIRSFMDEAEHNAAGNEITLRKRA